MPISSYNHQTSQLATKQRLAKWFLIRPGEGGSVFYLAALYLIIGLGMAVGRSSSDALFFKRFGVEYLPHMFFMTSILLVIFCAVYAEFADRVRHWRMFQVLFLILGGFLLADWILMNTGARKLGYALYFLGYGVVSEIIIVHFNLYISGFLDALQCKRLFPLINASSRLGAVCGGVLLGVSSAYWPTENMALAWAFLLLVGLAIILYRHRAERSAAADARPRKRYRKSFADIREGLNFARRSALLQITGIGVFIMIALVSVQDFLVSTILTAHFRDERSLAAFFGWFFAGTNTAVLLLQLLTTNRLLRRFGLKTVNLIFPWSTIFSFALLSASATFIPALIARFNYMGMLPAFRNPAANLFYNALPAYMQGRARALSIGLVLPLGLATAGLLLMFAPKHIAGEQLALFCLAASFVYLYFKNRKNQVYSESMIELIQRQVFSRKTGELEDFGHLDNPTINKLTELLQQTQSEEAISSYVHILLHGAPQQAGTILIGILPTLHCPLQDRIMHEMARLDLPGWEDHARQCLTDGDQHLRASTLGLLTARNDATAWQHAQAWLGVGSPRLRAAAASAILANKHTDLASAARQVLLDMLSSDSPEQIQAALSVLELLPESGMIEKIRALTQRPEPRIMASAIISLGTVCRHTDQDCLPELTGALENIAPEVRAAAICAATKLPTTAHRLDLLAHTLLDQSLSVRQAALKHAAGCMPLTLEEYGWALDAYFDNFSMQSLLCKNLSYTDLPKKRELLLKIGLQHLCKAYDKKTVTQLFNRPPLQAQNDTHASSFLALVLREEIQRHLGQALEIMENLDEGQSVQAIRAALASRDRRLRAQAIESVRHVENDILLHMLLPLLEAEYDGAEWRHPLKQTLATLEEVQEWCTREGSTWLRQCATVLGNANRAS